MDKGQPDDKKRPNSDRQQNGKPETNLQGSFMQKRNSSSSWRRSPSHQGSAHSSSETAPGLVSALRALASSHTGVGSPHESRRTSATTSSSSTSTNSSGPSSTSSLSNSAVSFFEPLTPMSIGGTMTPPLRSMSSNELFQSPIEILLEGVQLQLEQERMERERMVEWIESVNQQMFQQLAVLKATLDAVLKSQKSFTPGTPLEAPPGFMKWSGLQADTETEGEEGDEREVSGGVAAYSSESEQECPSRDSVLSLSDSESDSDKVSSRTKTRPRLRSRSSLAATSFPPPPPVSVAPPSSTPVAPLPASSSSSLASSSSSSATPSTPANPLILDLKKRLSSGPILMSSQESIAGQLVVQSAEFKVEFGRSDIKQSLSTLKLLEENHDIPYYRKFFFNKPHTNYLVQDERKGLMCISIADKHEGQVVSEDTKFFALMKTNQGTVFFTVMGAKHKKKKMMFAAGLDETAPIKEVKDPLIQNSLLQMEDKLIHDRKHCKIGILYCRDGTQTENEMFNNVDPSDDFLEFLGFIGEKITLNGWTGYSGGLDTKRDSTGVESIYCKHRGVDVMFHVSTMLPFSADDEQQVERKRHLGNDVVLIIFKEGNAPFDPRIIRSQFNSIYAVISKENDPTYSTTHYRLNVASKEYISNFPPNLPVPPVFKKGDLFHDVLLTKLINGERTAMHSKDFASRLQRAWKGTLDQLGRDFWAKRKE